MYDKLITTDDLTQVVEKVQQLRVSDKQAAEQAATALSNGKADKATSLSGYGITDAYTKNETDERIQAVVGTAPAALDTLGEIADKLSDSDSAVSGIINTLADKSDKSSTVTNVSYTSNKFQKTINGNTTDIVTASDIVLNGGGVKSVKVGTNSAVNPDVDGIVSIPAYPTTLPASDVSAWAKASTKPTYNYSEIQGTPTIPTVPTNVSSFTNDAQYITLADVPQETDPTVPSWAKQQNKPSYNYSEINNTPTNLSQFTNDSNYVTARLKAFGFAGLEIASGPLYYGTNGYEIKDHWSYNSYGSVYGKNVGSTYFNFLEMGELFEKSGFSTSDEDIENLLDPLNGWRLPTKNEWEAIVGTTRPGSTVNGTIAHYALIQLTGVTYAGRSTPYGLLIFPDGETITGTTLSNIDNVTVNTSITEAQLNEYLNQRCTFLPCNGDYFAYIFDWNNGGVSGNYWSSSQYNPNPDVAYHLALLNYTIIPSAYTNKSTYYFGVRLVREVNSVDLYNNNNQIYPTTISQNVIVTGGDDLQTALNNKVDKISGKGLSKNDFTDALKTKLDGIASNAQVNVLEGVQVNGEDLSITSKKVNIDISGKADKVSNAVAGDIAKLDANGNLVDGGNTVEYSKNLAIESISKPNSEFWYRKTGGGIISTNTSGHGRISRIYGKSIIWNQLVQNGNFADNSVWSNIGTTSNGVRTVSRTATGSAITQSLAQNMSYANNHKYLFFASLKSNNSSTTISLFPTGTSLDGTTVYNYYSEWTRVSYLWTKTGTDHQLQFRGYNQTDPSVDVNFSVKNVVCFDLTQMFGSGNEPSTAAEFEAMFPEEYYEYNAGEIRSLDFDAIETIGFNQWDGEIELGNVSSASGQISSHATSRYSKNFIPIIPNTQYYLYRPNGILIYPRYYDINKNYLTFAELGISDVATSGNFTTPARAYYMRFVSTASSNNTYPDNPEICINLSDPTRNGTYEPYWKKTNYVKISRDLRQRDLFDDHNYIFPEGLRSAGNVYDEIVGNKAIKRVEKINLGDLSWSLSGQRDHVFSASISTIRVSSGSGTVSNILCPKYLTVNKTTWVNLETMDQVIMQPGGNTDTKNIGISDSNYSTAAELKTSLSGVYCLYELETPVEYDLPQDWRYQIDTYGTERFVGANMPIKADIDYTLIDKLTKSALDENYLSPQIDKEIITTEPISFIGTNFDNNKFQITSELWNGNAVTLGWRENGSNITFLGTNSLLDQGELSGAIMFNITDGTRHNYLDMFPNGTFTWNNSNVLTAAQISARTNTAAWGSNVSLGTIGDTEFKFKMPDCNIAWVTNCSGTVGSTASGSYNRTQWTGTVSGLTSLSDGLMVAYKIPVAGCGRGNTLNINGLGEHPCLYNGSTLMTTHYPVDTVLLLIYDSEKTMSLYVNNVSTSFTGCWTTFCHDSGNTKNTAGTTNNAATKLFLTGATEQSANPQTYSNVNVYIGTDNCLYSNGKKVVTQDQLTDIETLLASI